MYGKETIGTSAMTFHGLTLGQLNPFDPEEEIAISTNDRDLYIISRSTDEYARTYATPGTVLLRDVVSLTYTVHQRGGGGRALLQVRWRAQEQVLLKRTLLRK